MRGKWDLNTEELHYWERRAIREIEDLQNKISPIIDLTREDITPFQVNQVLETLGWKRYNEFSSIEGGRYAFYKKHGSLSLAVYCSTLTFELVVYLQENFEKVDFKRNHIKSMLSE